MTMLLWTKSVLSKFSRLRSYYNRTDFFGIKISQYRFCSQLNNQPITATNDFSSQNNLKRYHFAPSFYKYFNFFLIENEFYKHIPKELQFSYKQLLEEFDEIYEIVSTNQTNTNRTDISKDDQEFLDLANRELLELVEKLIELQENMIVNTVVDDRDVTECTLEIKAGVGGKEAILFAEELFKLYLKFIVYNGWETRVDKNDFEQVNTDDNSSLFTTSVEIIGQGCYQSLRHEAGVHRVQRVPKTEKHGRIHTSTVSISVLPVRNNLVVVKDSDLKFDVKNSSGAGGQNVNRNFTCVRVTHLPTGHTAESQETRFQYLNKEIAIRKIKALLNQIEYDRLEKEVRKQKRLQIGFSARSDKIRTYNFPQDRITDHRLLGDSSLHNIVAYMNGEQCSKMMQNIDRLENMRHQQLVKQVLSAFEQAFLKENNINS